MLDLYDVPRSVKMYYVKLGRSRADGQTVHTGGAPPKTATRLQISYSLTQNCVKQARIFNFYLKGALVWIFFILSMNLLRLPAIIFFRRYPDTSEIGIGGVLCVRGANEDN